MLSVTVDYLESRVKYAELDADGAPLARPPAADTAGYVDCWTSGGTSNLLGHVNPRVEGGDAGVLDRTREQDILCFAPGTGSLQDPGEMLEPCLGWCLFYVG